MHDEDGSNPDGEIVRYFICEDCVIDHKKYGWKLGEELCPNNGAYRAAPGHIPV